MCFNTHSYMNLQYFYDVSKYLIKMNMPYKLKNIYISYKYNVEEIVSVFQQEEEYHVTQ